MELKTNYAKSYLGGEMDQRKIRRLYTKKMSKIMKEQRIL